MSEICDKARDHMEKCLKALTSNFSKVRTGRANPHVLDAIKVDYYGQATPITQLAGVKVPEAKREQGRIQKLTDSYVAKIDEMLKAKESEVMEI